MRNIIKAILTTLLILVMAGSAMCVPSEFDWRNVDGVNYVTPIKDQGGCGSCAIFAAVAAVESTILIEHPEITEIDLSEQYFVSDCWLSGDCGGAFSADVLYTVENDGIPLESCFPYIANNSPCDCCENWEYQAWHITTYSEIGYCSDGYYKTKIMETGPLAVEIDTRDFHEPNTSQSPAGSHMVLIIGWNDTEGCWIAKNSRHPNWGDNGCGRILYGSIGRNQDDVFIVSGAYQGSVYDLNGDGFVNDGDVLEIVLHWGPCSGCHYDLNGDGFVNNDDIILIFDNWGPCP